MELESLARPMTADEELSFLHALELNEQASVLLLYGFKVEAALTLEDAADYAVTKAAKVALLRRAEQLLLDVLGWERGSIH